MQSDPLGGVRASWASSLRRHRRERGWSQRELAEQTGRAGGSISVAHISNIETGRTSISDRNRVALAAALGLRVEDLFPYDDHLAAS